MVLCMKHGIATPTVTGVQRCAQMHQTIVYRPATGEPSTQPLPQVVALHLVLYQFGSQQNTICIRGGAETNWCFDKGGGGQCTVHSVRCAVVAVRMEQRAKCVLSIQRAVRGAGTGRATAARPRYRSVGDACQGRRDAEKRVGPPVPPSPFHRPLHPPTTTITHAMRARGGAGAYAHPHPHFQVRLDMCGCGRSLSTTARGQQSRQELQEPVHSEAQKGSAVVLQRLICFEVPSLRWTPAAQTTVRMAVRYRSIGMM